MYVYVFVWGEMVTREVGQSCSDGLELHNDVFLSTARQILCEVIGVNKGHSFLKELYGSKASRVSFV
jgi:hypothetical protein